MGERRFSGASYDPKRDCWTARIMFNRVTYRKRFKTKEEAEEWYHQKSIELHHGDVVVEPEQEEVFDEATITEINQEGSPYEWK